MAIYTGSANLYTLGKLKRGQKVYSFDTDTFQVLLTTSSHTPDQAADEFVDDITEDMYKVPSEETAGSPGTPARTAVQKISPQGITA